MTNQNTTTSNQELLSWAVENIEEWDDDYTHLRSDISKEPFFTTKNYPWYIDPDDKQWKYNDLRGYGRAYLEAGKEFSTDTPQVITKEEWTAAIIAKNASTTSSQAQQGHVHAELMAEYALVAKTNPEPWKEFEVLNSEVKGWEELDASPRWFPDAQYRRKPTPPKTMNIGGIVVEAWPLEEMPSAGLSYWALIVEDNAKFDADKFTNDQDSLDEAILYAGKAFSTKE